jgi:transcriptional antiterminator NusG
MSERSRSWLAVRVRSNFEKYVSLSLRGKNVEEFLPTYVRRTPHRRAVDVQDPLFPGYLFCRPSYEDRLTVLKIPGVLDFVGIGKQPLAVEENEICDIQKMVQSSLPIWPCASFRIGQRVRLIEGPLCGLEGAVLSIKDSWHIIVSVTLLQRSVAVNVEARWIGR